MVRAYPAALAAACLFALPAAPAFAHVIAGNRVFPVTLTIDDPGTADEVSIPAFTYNRQGANGGTGPSHEFDFGFEYDKTITGNTAIIFNDGYDVIQQNGSKTQAGFENLYVTGKWQAYTNAAHEFVLSLGIIREIGGTGTTHTGGDRYGSTAPTGYFGKGLGDLPIGILRPLAITGELSYVVADHKLKALPQQPAGGGVDDVLAGVRHGNRGAVQQRQQQRLVGLASRCSTASPTCRSQVKDLGLPSLPRQSWCRWWRSPGPPPPPRRVRRVSTWTAAPGLIYLAQLGRGGGRGVDPAQPHDGDDRRRRGPGAFLP